MILLTLYATGSTADEVLSLRCSRVNLKRREIVLGAGRSIPIGTDLTVTLANYITSTRHAGKTDVLVFRCADDRKISRNYFGERFRHLVATVGLKRKPDGRVPRLQDLRFTFAVHRLAHWIRQKADLNELLPALSTYMGYSSLTKAEQFLSFVPERFRQDLQKLSPRRGRRRWRDQPELLCYVASL